MHWRWSVGSFLSVWAPPSSAVCCTVYVAAAQKSYLFLGFLAFLFPTSLKYFPGRGRFGCLRMCVCVFAHSFDSGSYPDKLEIMRTVWTVTNEHKWQASFWEKEGSTWDNSPTTCSGNVSFNQWRHLLSSWIHIRHFFPAFLFFRGTRDCFLSSETKLFSVVCVFFNVSVKSIDMLYLQHHLTTDLTLFQSLE